MFFLQAGLAKFPRADWAPGQELDGQCTSRQAPAALVQMAAKRRRDRSHICVNTHRGITWELQANRIMWRGEKAEPRAEKFKHLKVFLLHWAGNFPHPSLFQLSNLFMESSKSWFHIFHDPRVLYFHFYFPTSFQQDFPSSSCSHIWPELQSGLQPFPGISLGWILGLFARKYSCRSILGSKGWHWQLVVSSEAFWSCSTIKNPTELCGLKQLNWHTGVEVIPSFSH